MSATEFALKKYSDTSNAIGVLELLFAFTGIGLVSGLLNGLLFIIVLIIFAATGLFALYIVMQYYHSHGEYWFAPFKKRRLERAAEQWLESVDHIKCTGDYGMCCNEETAIQTSKEYYFGNLITYADVYIAERKKH